MRGFLAAARAASSGTRLLRGLPSRCFATDGVSGPRFRPGAGQGPTAKRARSAGRTGLGRISDGSILADASPEGVVPGPGGVTDPSAAVARIGTAVAKPDRLDDAIRYYDRRIGPAYQRCAGFAGAWLLVDRASGTINSLSLWQSQGALEASAASENYQKVASGLLQLVVPSTMAAQSYEVAAAVTGTEPLVMEGGGSG